MYVIPRRFWVPCNLAPFHGVATRYIKRVDVDGDQNAPTSYERVTVPVPDDVEAYLKPEKVGLILRVKRGWFRGRQPERMRSFHHVVYKVEEFYAVVMKIHAEYPGLPFDYYTWWYTPPTHGAWVPVAPDDPALLHAVEQRALNRILQALAAQ